MHFTAVIPARMASTRLPGKPLIMINNKTLIQRVYEAVRKTNLFNEVFIATDNIEIFEHVKSFNADVVMTSEKHSSGTDRIYECISKLKQTKSYHTDVIVNIQGDEPFISQAELSPLIKIFDDNEIEVASLMHKIDAIEDITNQNNVKVVIDSFSNAIYFSRSVIPFNRDSDIYVEYYKHIGVYAYTYNALERFINLKKGVLENIEKLEQLRFIENNIKIKMILSSYKGIGIDTQDDLLEAERIIKEIECIKTV